MISTKQQILLNKINIIKQYILGDSVELNNWETREGIYEEPGKYSIIDPEWKKIDLGSVWSCGDAITKWFKTKVVIPENFNGKKVVLDLDFGGEGLVYIDGKIKSAVTSYLEPDVAARSRVSISHSAEASTVFDVLAEVGLNYMEFAKFRKNGAISVDYKFKGAKLAVVDTKIEDYYFDVIVTYEVLQVLRGNPFDPYRRSGVRLPREFYNFMELCNKDSYMHDKVLDALCSSLALIDVDFGRENLVASIDAAKNLLWEKLNLIQHSPHGLISFTGHSHIDTAWLWPIKETVRKCSRTFSNTLALMDEYPEHIFAQSQPQLYQYTKVNYPELYEKIKEKVKEGKWELIGNSWIETDTNIPSGESLVRQILYGLNFFKNEFGKWSKIFWMPDVFGYSWALPQIIKRSGMEYFMTAKLNNNDINIFPYTIFQWQGIDGTKILSYLQRVSYNGEINPVYMNNAWDNFDEKDLFNEVMITYGFGDGGGGPTYQMLEYGRRLKEFPGMERSCISTAESFFENASDVESELPVWNDEMYYEFHRGTYTSQANTKKNNRKSEILYRNAEIVSAIAMDKLGVEYPLEMLTEGWKLILLNQFHDIIPGSSINEVYKDSEKDFTKVFSDGEKIENNALSIIANNISSDGDSSSIVVFNFLSWECTGVVEIKVPLIKTSFSIVDCNNISVPFVVNVVDDNFMKLCFEAKSVPPIGYATYRIINKEPEKMDASIVVKKDYMENEYYKIIINTNGNISEIYDKINRRNIITAGKCGNVLQVFEDKPERESAWNIDLEYQNKCWELSDIKAVEVIEASNARGVLRIVKTFNKSEITQDITIYSSIPRIDFYTSVEWYETEKLLKAAFNVDILSPKATYEIAFGSIDRPTHWNTSWDKAKFEVPAHKWADLSEGDYGVSLLNDCKYGYDIKDNTMRITLLRAPVYPDPVADKGHHEFAYSLYPHSGDWRSGDVVHAGYNLNIPLKPLYRDVGEYGSLPDSMSFIEIDSPNVIIDTLKAAENGEGIILRVYESNGSRCEATVKTALNINQVTECNLIEVNEQDINLSKGMFKFNIKPYEIKTFRLRN